MNSSAQRHLGLSQFTWATQFSTRSMASEHRDHALVQRQRAFDLDANEIFGVIEGEVVCVMLFEARGDRMRETNLAIGATQHDPTPLRKRSRHTLPTDLPLQISALLGAQNQSCHRTTSRTLVRHQKPPCSNGRIERNKLQFQAARAGTHRSHLRACPLFG